MRITSRDFIHGQFLPPKCTNQGDNLSPSIVIQSVPHGTQSLAVVMQSAGKDTDPPETNSNGKYHWLVWNISPDVNHIPTGATPKGATVGINDYWESKYGGPYPPPGECHKYKITVYALNTSLNLPSSTPPTELIATLKNHIIDQGEIVGYFERK